MNRLAMFALCLCLLCAGCVDHQGSGTKNSAKVETLYVAITSPESGATITGDKDIKFESAVKGGNKPYVFGWSSNLGGILSTESSFTRRSSKMQKGEHYIILRVTDASGNTSEATCLLRLFSS
jgi:hypothetical protein